MASSSKGFKYSKGKKVDDPEELSYDEVEVTRKDTGKRKAALHDTSTSSKKSRTSVASSRGSKVSTGSVKSNNSKNKTQMVQKHHYPSSLCDPSVELLEHMRQGSHHRQIFTKLVDEIVESERNTIQAYALSENAKSLKGRKHIFETLDSVMETWASEVHNLCPESVVFEPEISKAERSELKPLHETKLALEKHSQKLGQFENDFKRLAQEYDIWLGSEIVMSKLEHAATLGNAAQSTELASMLQYKELLQALEHHCDQILASADTTEDAVAQAQQAKDELYLTFSKAREIALNGTKVPRDAKDLLKKMPAFF